jgi:hypothetical protein
VEDHLVRFNRIYKWLTESQGTEAGDRDIETPNSKLQTSEKLQSPSSKPERTASPKPQADLLSTKASPTAPAEERESESDFLGWLQDVESRDNLFPHIDYRYWRGSEK